MLGYGLHGEEIMNEWKWMEWMNENDHWTTQNIKHFDSSKWIHIFFKYLLVEKFSSLQVLNFQWCQTKNLSWDHETNKNKQG